MIRALTKISRCGVYMRTISTAQATGIAALHACFLPVNLPYCMEITQVIQAQNRHVKKNTQKILETVCKILHIDYMQLTTFIFG